MASAKVIGIGAAIIDYLVEVAPAFVEAHGGNLGGRQEIDLETFQTIVGQLPSPAKLVPGGSCYNTLRGLKAFGHDVDLLGAIGNDSLAEDFKTNLIERGIGSRLIEMDGSTARVISMITPDKQRTFRTLMGVSKQLTAQALHIEEAHLLHIEGYALLNPSVVEVATTLAKDKGMSVSLDLAAFEIVLENSSRIEALLPHLDIIFANEDEAFALTGLTGQECSEVLSQKGPTACILAGAEGVYVGKKGQSFHCPSEPVPVIDTTGAGDLFASGFLASTLRGESLEAAAQQGTRAAAAVIQVVGAEVPHAL